MRNSNFIASLLLILITSFYGLAQDVSLSTQAEVDAFDSNTTTISGNLHIGGSTQGQSFITDLSSLSNLTSIGGDLEIAFTSSLVDVDDLSNLSSIGGELNIRFNDVLQHLDGFSSLTFLGDILGLSNNESLMDVDGLINLTSLDGSVYIQSNPALSNLNGLSNLNTIIGDFGLYHDNAFTNVDPLSSLTSIGGTLEIYNSDALLNIDGLSNLTSIGGDLDMRFNQNLVHINGLSGVLSIGGYIDLSANGALINLDGLSGLSSLNDFLKLQSNTSLANINGLLNLTSVGGNFIINANPVLVNLDGLSNLSSVTGNFQNVANESLVDMNSLYNLTTVGGNMQVSYNDGLLTLNGLSGLTSVGNDLDISENIILTECCAIQYLLYTPNAVSGDIMINNNPMPCDSQSAILDDDCGNVIHIIEGNVFLDNNANCQYESGDIPFESIIVQAESPEFIYTVVTDATGIYKFYVDTGNYEVVAYMPNPYVDLCTTSYTADILDDTVSDSFYFEFPAIIDAYCPYLEVDIGTWALRECFDNNYYIQYCNSGTLDATNAYVELELDSVLSIAGASIPFTGPDANNIYTFDVGTVDIGDCGNFSVNIHLPCDTLNAGQFQGHTYCVNAHIYPDSICLSPSSSWDGSSVEVSGNCEQDSVVFRVRNIGQGDMQTDKNLYIFEDQVMIGDSTFQLVMGEEIKISYYANGSTFRLDAEQSDNHPGNSNPSVVIEGCGAGPIFSLGFLNQFSHDDGDVFVSTECTEVTGSYDPNDKQAVPVGYGDEHYIEENTDIEYMIRFQNTGTDTAFTVVIQDEISELLDITTINPGASSHPYTFEIDSVVRFVFNDILLVDSLTNEPASHGFVKFKIAQKANLPIGSVIENTAGIYFDFNAPIITNTTFHTIGEDFITIDLINNIPDVFQIQSAKVYPNPFSEVITFEFDGVIEDEIVLSVYDVNGKEVARKIYNSSNFQFNRGDLNHGIYFYMISSDGVGIAKGKMIIN